MSVLRSVLISLSYSQTLHRWMQRSSCGNKIGVRLIAGKTVEAALRTAESLQEQGIAVAFNALGQSVGTETEAQQSAWIYHRLLDQIAVRNLDANISVKPTQVGLKISLSLAESILGDLARHAMSTGSFIRIDMEDSSLTQRTLDLVRRIHAQSELSGAAGVAIQSYLYRSQADVEQLLADGIRIRLCKGAYRESSAVAFPRTTDVNTNYVRLAAMLLESKIDHALATHDETMIAAGKRMATEHCVDKKCIEFQMLYGIRSDLQRQLVSEGYRVRVYVPFGPEWYPYFMRRLAERPGNAFSLLKNTFRT